MKSKTTASRVRSILLLLGILVAAVCAVLFFSVDSSAGLSHGHTSDVFNAILPDGGTVFELKTLTVGGDRALVQLK